MRAADLASRIAERAPLDVVPGLTAALVGRGRVLDFARGQHVIARGAVLDALLVPIRGKLQSDASEVAPPCPRLRSFEVIGLGHLLEGTPFPCAVRAETDCFVVALAKEDFLSCVTGDRVTERYLRLVTAAEGLRRFGRLLSERGLAKADILRVFARIEAAPVVLRPGERVPDRPSLWIVDSGEVIAHRRERRARFDCGTFFGGECLVRSVDPEDRAIAHGAAVLYEVPALGARALLAELHLLDLLVDETHVVAFDDDAPGSPADACTALPGVPSDPADVWHYGLRVEVNRLHQACSDAEANIGAVCNLLLFLGLSPNTSAIRAELTALPRVTYLRVAEIVEPYGVAARARRADLRMLARQARPALVALRGRLCVLLAVKTRPERAMVHDPVRGFVELSWTELASVWDGSVLEADVVDADDGAEPAERPSLKEGPTARTLLMLVVEHRRLFVNTALLSVLTIALAVAQPRLAQVVLDEVLTLRDVAVLVSCASGILLCSALLAVVRWAQQLVYAEIVSALDGRLAELFYRRALGLPAGALGRRRAGDILARLRDLEDLRDFFSLDSLQVVVKLASVAVVSVLLALYSGAIACLALAFGAATILFQLAIAGTLYRNTTRAARDATVATSLVAEQAASVSTVKAFGAAGALRERWERAYLRSRQLGLRNELLTSGSTTLLQTLGAVARIGGLWLAARAAMQGAVTAGEILAITMYLNHVVERTGDIGSFFSRLWSVRTTLANVRRIFDAPQEAAGKKPLTTMSARLQGRIKIEGLGFRYGDDGDWVLRGVDLTIFPGQTVALVGPSGSGKTTLAHVIAGNLRPAAGRILYDGVDGELLAQGSLRRHIGFVTQSHELFQGSIGENVSFADDAPCDSDIARALQQAHAAPFVTRLPGGASSVLGECGTGLSGGQMQRLSIARTLYRDPSVFVFDEATSQLDAESEEAIVDSMRRLVRGRTSIIIAHRLSTIRHADVIFVMKDGAIVEEGTHAQLMGQNGHYAELFARQDAAIEA